MPRRLLVDTLAPGRIELPPDQAHHARDVLRLREGDEVELFTAAGQTAPAKLVSVTPRAVTADVQDVRQPADRALTLSIASAIPKAARADWLIEKLSELGVARFIPLITDRSVVHPEGKGKLQRWQRLAAEAAKQSRRPGVMQIAPLTALKDLLANPPAGARIATLSTSPDAQLPSSILHPFDKLRAGSPSSSFLLLVGPEGGWSDAERTLFSQRRLTPITLGATILRVETAAIAAAAVINALLAERTQL
jgi:16S rRNA (uracil1498-N3)-methyltransferase